MTASPERGTPLAELLQALAPPLEYLAADDFRRLDQTRLPLDALAARLARARAGSGGAAAAPLAELSEVFATLQHEPAETHGAALRRAHALLPALREAVGTTPAWADYRPATGPVEPALAALAGSVEVVRAVGPKRTADLARFGLATVEDLLFHLPFRYEDRRALRPLAELRVGDEATAIGEVARAREGQVGRRGRRVLEVVLRDAGMIHPEIETLAPEEAIVARVLPVYEKPTEMHVGAMRRIVHAAVDEFADRVPSALPPDVAARHRLVDLPRALRHVHSPAPEADLEALGASRSVAHRSLIFDELFFLQLGLALRRSASGQEEGSAFPRSTRLVPALYARLPFRATGAQDRAFAEIEADLAAPHPMRRLLQGDVGSGKTLVALLAALTVIEAGHQVALMAPTELLAEQHLETVRPLAEPLGVNVALLTGAVKGRARREALAGLATGRIALAVGTHALIQEGVDFGRLGLAIVDEQHRFGVLQRAALQRQAGGQGVDVLVMSATPIPRTLALTLYGDLAVSTLDELPPGRTPITTRLCRESRRDEVYARVREAVAAGHQAYIVYPLVEESEKSSLRAASTMVHELGAGPLNGLRLGLVHGRMKPEEKDRVMRRFKTRDFDVLVSTTVIEVGIDVPNATVIAIEHAERFGLAQLHQLRGRVGRGEAPGHCVLVVPDWTGEEAYQRLTTLERSTDGFYIAEADLALRGPGDFLGTRQAGLPPFRVASLVRDSALLRAARDEALAWLTRDPDLSRPESETIRAVLRHRWRGRLGLAQVG